METLVENNILNSLNIRKGNNYEVPYEQYIYRYNVNDHSDYV